jgi:hypothetical protein
MSAASATAEEVTRAGIAEHVTPLSTGRRWNTLYTTLDGPATVVISTSRG